MVQFEPGLDQIDSGACRTQVGFACRLLGLGTSVHEEFRVPEHPLGQREAELRAELNKHGVPEFEASALKGRGVIETLRAVVRSVSSDLERRL